MGQGDFVIRKAERSQVRIKIGMFGPSGSGKTYSSLLLAYGLCKDWEKIAVIDTERASADLYDHLGPFSTLQLKPPYSPDRYIKALRACEAQGYDVIIIDSISHEWDGTGGCLDIVQSFKDWKHVGALHNQFIDTIMDVDAHVICSGRVKTEYVVTTTEGKQGRDNIEVKKLGLKATTREGFEYEMYVSFDLNQDHLAVTSKDRTGLFMDRAPFIIGPETGEELIEWIETGKPSKQSLGLTIREMFSKYGFTRTDFSDLPAIAEYKTATAEDLEEAIKVIEKAGRDSLKATAKNAKTGEHTTNGKTETAAAK